MLPAPRPRGRPPGVPNRPKLVLSTTDCRCGCQANVKRLNEQVESLEQQIDVLTTLLIKYVNEQNRGEHKTINFTSLKRSSPGRGEQEETVLGYDKTQDIKLAIPTLRQSLRSRSDGPSTSKRIRTGNDSQDAPPTLTDEGGMSALELMGESDEEEDDEPGSAPNLEENDEELVILSGEDDDDEAPRLEMAGTPPPTLDPAVGMSVEDIEDDETGDEEEKILHQKAVDSEEEEQDQDVEKQLNESKWLLKANPLLEKGIYFLNEEEATDEQIDLLVDRLILLGEFKKDDFSSISVLNSLTVPWASGLSLDQITESLRRLEKEGFLKETTPANYKMIRILNDATSFKLKLARRCIRLSDYHSTFSQPDPDL